MIQKFIFQWKRLLVLPTAPGTEQESKILSDNQSQSGYEVSSTSDDRMEDFLILILSEKCDPDPDPEF